MFSQARFYVSSAIVAIAGSVGLYLFRKAKRTFPMPTDWEPIAKVSNLYIYPLKSGRRVELKRAECTPTGLRICKEDNENYQMKDRSFVVYGADNFEFKTARTFPQLLQVRVTVYDKEHLAFTAPEMEELIVRIPTAETNPAIKVNMRGEQIPSFDCGEKAAIWFTKYMANKEDKSFRLAFYDMEVQRNAATSFDKEMVEYSNLCDDSLGLFSDMSSCLLINERSITVLNDKLDEKDQVTHHNFRPNIVVNAIVCPPYDEDEWEYIKIGDVILRTTLPCTRCILTTIDPENGTRNKKMEPLQTLKKYRILESKVEARNKSPSMGTNLQILVPGIISTNDKVYIGKL